LGITLLKAWIVLYRDDGGVTRHAICATEEDFHRVLKRIARDYEDVACLIPTDFYKPYYVGENEI